MPELQLGRAKKVIEEAIRYEAFSWDDPKDATEESIMTYAGSLLEAATTAAKNGSVAVAVLEIIKAAGDQLEPFEMAPQTLEAYQQRFGTNGHTAPVESDPAPESSLTGEDSPGTPTEESAKAPALDISDVFPGYDELKAAEIKKAILDSAASGDLTEEEWEKIKAYESATEERKTILNLQPEFKQPEPEPIPEPEPAPSEQVVDTTKPLPNTDVDDVDIFYAGTTKSRAEQEGLPIPQQVDTSQHPPVLPIDITTVSDQELSRVATQFHSCFAYAQWLQSQEEGRERAAEHLEHEAHRDAYVQAYENHKSAIPADKMTGTAIDNARKQADKDADGADAVRKYRSAKVRHGIDARELKALASGYDKAVWRINEEMDRRARLSTNSRAT